MNDERVERELREAARRLAGGPASADLHARVAAIPGGHPRAARRRRLLGAGRRLAGAAAAVVVLVVAGALIVAIRPHDSVVGPTVSGSPIAGPSGTPSSTPPATSSPSAVSPALTLAWTQVMGSTSGSPLLVDGDTIMSAIPFGGGYLLAGNAGAGQRAVVWRSADGVTWQRIESGPSFADSTISTLVAIPSGVLAIGTAATLDSLCSGGEGTNCNPVSPIRLWTSSDGITWQRLPDAATAPFGRASLGPVVAGPGGLVLFGWHQPVSSSAPTTPAEWTSADGRTWTAQTQFATAFPDGVVEGLVALTDGYAAVGRNTGLGSGHAAGTAWFSGDGRTWTMATVPVSAATDEQTSIYAGASGLLAVGSNTTRTFWSSADGRSWTSVDLATVPFSATSSSPVLVDDGSRIVAIGIDHAGAAGGWVSTDGVAWQPIAGFEPAATGPIPQIPNTDTGLSAIGALGPRGVVLSTESGPGTLFSVWVGS